MKTLVKLHEKYKEIILYLVFGILTTIINVISFWLCNDILKMNYKLSNIIAWLLAVAFAFITNKLIVFESKQNILREGIVFFGARVFSLFVDMIIMIAMIDYLKIHALISKIIVNIIVVIINYIFSKYFIFQKRGN